MIPVANVHAEFKQMLSDLRIAEVGLPGDTPLIAGLRSLCRDVADALDTVLKAVANPQCPDCGGSTLIHKSECKMFGSEPYFMTAWVKSAPDETTNPNDNGNLLVKPS